MGEVFRDLRRGKNTQHELIGLLRQSVHRRLTGYEVTNDAERLAFDPTMRQVIEGQAGDRQATSTSQMALFETESLTTRKNLKSLMDQTGMWIDRIGQPRSFNKLILDLDPAAPGYRSILERTRRFAETPIRPAPT